MGAICYTKTGFSEKSSVNNHKIKCIVYRDKRIVKL